MILLSAYGTGCAEPARNLSTGVDEFCWKYFATLDRTENIFYSPYGLNAALSILANGASGNTRSEILHALEADNVENLNDGHKRFAEAVASNYGGENIFMASNLLLVDKKIIGRGVDDGFKRIVEDVYGSTVRPADFGGNLRGEQQRITRWVADKTGGFISNYQSIATRATLTDLLNVVCFKGKWAMPFKAHGTTRRVFNNRDGTESTVDMMSRVFDETIAYHEDDTFKAIALPYSANVVMYLILPVDDASLDIAELWLNQTQETRADFIAGLRRERAFEGEVVVRVPKFELDIENNLVDSFKALGVERAFSDGAEFFNIVKGTPLKIDNAKHRAKIRVDEQGTEAAAVTEVVMVEATAAPSFDEPRRVYFLAERPFLFMIRDASSDVTLFAGVVNRL